MLLKPEKIKGLICGIGNSEIQDDVISITEYPFEPSVAFPEKIIKADEIKSICADFGMVKVYVENDIVLVSAEYKESIKSFATRHEIPLAKETWNWDSILEPYLDTEFTEENQKRAWERLAGNGFEKSEVESMRKEVGASMYVYNFGTGLWDWVSLGLSDVLAAMRWHYDKEAFKDFYKRAIEIDQRGAL